MIDLDEILRLSEPCFRHVYPRVVPGGLVVDDDFGFGGIRDVVEEIAGPLPKTTKIDAGCFAWRRT